MLNNLTTKFQEALMQAQQTAGRLGKPEISSLDVLVALLEQEGGIPVSYTHLTLPTIA